MAPTHKFAFPSWQQGKHRMVRMKLRTAALGERDHHKLIVFGSEAASPPSACARAGSPMSGGRTQDEFQRN